MYNILEISLADTHRLYYYKQQNVFGTDFSLKGFEYPWILASHSWKEGEKVLDIGAAYSFLPIHIQRTYDCETWVVDDFGLNSNEPFYTRHKDPYKHIKKHPQVEFVLERLGDPSQSSLPRGYFDLIYSASALEHVPHALTPQVWKHMDLLLKPGGEMLHAIDISFPSNGGPWNLLKACAFDTFYTLLHEQFRQRHCFSTPRSYVRLVFEMLDFNKKVMKNISVLNMVLDPEVLTENYSIGFNRIIKDKMTKFRYNRMGALLLRMKKV